MPCRRGMRGCKPSCLHRRFVMDYRMARHAAELERESVTAGYAAELAAYPPLVTFKTWLQATAREA